MPPAIAVPEATGDDTAGLRRPDGLGDGGRHPRHLVRVEEIGEVAADQSVRLRSRPASHRRTLEADRAVGADARALEKRARQSQRATRRLF